MRELGRALEQIGFVRMKGGFHSIHYVHPSGGRPIVIPDHPGDLRNGTLVAITRQVRQITGITLVI